MFIHLSDVWDLRPIVRKTGTRVVVLKRYGLPFFIPSIWNRKTFIVGISVVLLALYISSHFVWNIQLDGNTKITEDAMGHLLNQQGISVGCKIKNVDLVELEKNIRNHFPEITWVSVQLDGTGLKIFIKENDAPLVSEDLDPPKGMDLVSEYNGRIVSMVVRKGVPNTSEGKEVKEGDILVLGQVPVYHEDGTIKDYQLVEPKAEIWMEHETIFEYTLPFVYQSQEYTGRTEGDYYVRFGSTVLGENKSVSFLNFDSIRKESSIHLFEKLSIPILFGSILHREYQFFEKEYSLQEAERLLNEEIVKFTDGLSEKGVHILENNVTIDTTVDGWTVTGQFLVLERVFATD